MLNVTNAVIGISVAMSALGTGSAIGRIGMKKIKIVGTMITTSFSASVMVQRVTVVVLLMMVSVLVFSLMVVLLWVVLLLVLALLVVVLVHLVLVVVSVVLFFLFVVIILMVTYVCVKNINDCMSVIQCFGKLDHILPVAELFVI